MYRFIDADGNEAAMELPEDFIDAVHAGRISDDVLLLDPAVSRWRRAHEVDIYRVAKAALRVSERVKPGQASASPVPTQQCRQCSQPNEEVATICTRCRATLQHVDNDLWLYIAGERQQGPVPGTVLRSMLAARKIPEDTRIKGPGMIFWVAADTHPLFAELFTEPFDATTPKPVAGVNTHSDTARFDSDTQSARRRQHAADDDNEFQMTPRRLEARREPPSLPGAGAQHPSQGTESSLMHEGPAELRNKGQVGNEAPRPAPRPVEAATTEGGRSPAPSTSHGRKTVVGLYMMAGVSAIAALSSFGEYAFLQDVMAGAPFSDDRAATIDARQRLMAFLWIIGSLVVAVLFIRWLRNAHDQAVTMDPENVRYSKPWTIWGWIVPVVLLWIPFRIVKDTWRVLVGSDTDSAPGFMVWWWGLFLTMNALAYMSFQLVSREEPDLLLAGSATGMLSYLAAIPAALLAVRVVKEIDQALSVMGTPLSDDKA
jgi:hypothetical protein